MMLSLAHIEARAEASRLPALLASLALLTDGPYQPCIKIHAAPDPDSGAHLATINLAAGVGGVDESTLRLNLIVPLEGVVLAEGVAACGRVMDATGSVWGDVTVSDILGDGELKLETTALRPGTFARLLEAYFQG